MRRHRIQEEEVPATKRGLYMYLLDQADYPTDDEDNIMNGLKLFHRILRGIQGNPAYPPEFNEYETTGYNPVTVSNYLSLCEKTHPELRTMIPFSTLPSGGGPGPAHLSKAAPATPTTEAEA